MVNENLKNVNNKCNLLKVPMSRTMILVLSTLVCLHCLTPSNAVPVHNMYRANRSFSIDPKTYTFLKDGVPFQYISGSLHYFRIPAAYWWDRLQKSKAAGLDAIQIYIPWNYHEWEEGYYNFAGDRDLERFLQLVAKLDMLAIIRAGPYICAEWSFGGLPPWLLRKNPLIKIRSSSPDYYTFVTKWFDVLLPKLRPFLYENGGPIIMVQLENEYGSSSVCDKGYMSMMYDLARSHLGEDIILFTTDGNSEHYLRCGSPDQRYLATVDFGPTNKSAKEIFSIIEKFRPKQPLINSEFYVGWFDIWGDKHAHTSTDEVVSTLTNLVTYSKRVNVNLYVFHGGTTFGFWNGNPGTGPVLTSYDFDAPINEAGDLTNKYMVLRDVIHKLKNKKPPAMPKNTTKAAYGRVPMNLTNHMLIHLVPGNGTMFPVNMEAFSQYEGFLVYGTPLPHSVGNRLNLTFERVADIAHIYTSDDEMRDLHWHASLKGPYATTLLDMTQTKNHTRLLVLVENTGYINYGNHMWNDVKGIIRNVTFEGKPLSPWMTWLVPDMLGSLGPIQALPNWPIQGSIYTGNLVIKEGGEPQDTFIQPDAFGRGLIYINERNLGRYNQKVGPQLRLFVPKQFLRPGTNTITVVELETLYPGKTQVTFHAEPLLSP